MRLILTAALFTLAAALPAPAQAPCPAGKAANGQCVNPALVQTGQQTAIILSQPKISETAYPVLPSQDFDYRYPHALNPSPLKPSSTGNPG
jgi:hypothetical protein